MSNNLYHNLAELARKGGFILCDGSDGKTEPIDWRFIASIEPTRIVHESDFEKLDQCIPFLIRSSVGNLLNVRILDPAIAKIYIIAQLSLQYLLFCTKFLDKSVYSLRENIFNYQRKTVQLEEDLVKKEEEIEQLTKKLKRQDALNQQIFPCSKCTKNFLSAALLDSHIQRKHPPVQESKDKDSNLINTIKLELEIKQLKERLNVTEKELMDVARKDVFECEVCKKNAEKRFQSVAVQSNFEEKEKDDVEKDAISEMLRNQMKNFEELMHQTESRYNSEILELRGKLDEIELQKEIPRQPPSPAPRLSAISSEKLKEKQEEALWKERYRELEQMYEANQQRMALTVKSIESSYNEKMSKFEESVKILTEEREKVKNDLEEKIVEIEKKKLETSVKAFEPEKSENKILSFAKETEEVKRNEDFERKPQFPLTPRITVHHQVTSSESSSTESEEDEIEVIKVLPTKTLESPLIEPKPQPMKPKSIMETFSAQKFSIRPRKSKAPQKLQTKALATNIEPQKPLENSRGKAEELFSQRLKAMGIEEKSERMGNFEFENVYDSVVSKREQSKTQHKSFFITRKNLRSKVDKIFNSKQKMKEKEPKRKSYSEKNKEIPLNPDTNSPKFQKPSTSREFQKDLENVLANRFIQSNLKKPTEENLPVKNKKVLFDMKNLEIPKKAEEIREVEVNEDDSDFDISSFSEEK